MTATFNAQRSAAIRSALIAEASAVSVRRRPWRGLSLILVGVLAGTGATTAAFASGAPVPMAPVGGSRSASGGTPVENVLVLGGDGTVQPSVLAVTEVKGNAPSDGDDDSGGIALRRLKPVWTKTLTLTDGMSLRPPDDAGGRTSWVVISATCTGHGSFSIGSGDRTEMTECASGDQVVSVNRSAALSVRIEGSVTVVATVTSFAVATS